MKTRLFFDFHRRPPAKTALLLCVVLLHSQLSGLADTATVATNSNTLVTAGNAQVSAGALTSGYSPSQSLTLANAEKWTNLPGTPPNDSARIGPVIGVFFFD